MEVKPDHRLVVAPRRGQRLATGEKAVVGGWGRLGNVGDGQHPDVARHHPLAVRRGDIRIYRRADTGRARAAERSGPRRRERSVRHPSALRL